MNLFKVAKEKFTNNQLTIFNKGDLQDNFQFISSKDLFLSFINYKVHQDTLDTSEENQSDMLLFLLRTLIEDFYFENNIIGVILKNPENEFSEENIDDIIFSSALKLILAHAIQNVVAHKVTDKSSDEFVFFYIIAPNAKKHYFAVKKHSFRELNSLEVNNFPKEDVLKISNFASFVGFKEKFPKHILLPIRLEVLNHL